MERQPRDSYVVSDRTTRHASTYTLRPSSQLSYPHTWWYPYAYHRDPHLYDGHYHRHFMKPVIYMTPAPHPYRPAMPQ